MQKKHRVPSTIDVLLRLFVDDMTDLNLGGTGDVQTVA